MRLPKDILSGNYTKPRIFLCETNKEKICKLKTTSTQGSFKFNTYSELSFDVARIYNDVITGRTEVNPFYDKIESPRLIYLENFGYFELQGPELNGDGIKEVKSCTAYSSEYGLSTKFLNNFYVNTGKVDSLEVLNADDPEHIIPIILYDPNNTKLSLLHLVLEKVYGWKIGHVDSSLATLSRQFEVDRESVYDFLMNEVCEKFNCYIVFDTIENTINLYAESLTSKFVGDGETNTFTIFPPFAQVGAVSIDGYKTTRWEYDSATGALILEDTPEFGAHIEVVDGALTEWETDVFVTFDNLVQEVNVNYDADSIKTVLTVTYGDDLDIRETNLGLPYLTDISYYYTVDWMGQDLYDAYTAYMQKSNAYQSVYTNNSQEMLDIEKRISFEEHRLSLEYSIAQSVNATTVGTYYVRGGTAPNYYYTEASLPVDYDVNTTYYSMATTNLNEDKVANLLVVLKKYFSGEEDWEEELNKLVSDFEFMETYGIDYLSSGLKDAETDLEKETVVYNFLGEMWEQLGRTPLYRLYYEPYRQVQIANIEAGWSQKDNKNYWSYYAVVILLNSIMVANEWRQIAIMDYEKKYKVIQQKNADICSELLMDNNFTEQQLVRLSAFLREDELHLDDIVETDLTTTTESYKLKQDAMESGRIELNKRCQPQLQFSMSMANIYAIPEFEPIIDQFQLGNVIKVGLRGDYIKQSRLLQVDLNFDDLSDFSCEFGELTSLRSQSDIHADLLKKAVQAGKSVAANSSYWTKGSEQANSIDLRLQEGLLNSIEALKAIDGTQNAYMDKWGIHLEVVNPDTGEVGDKRVWMVNNQIVFTDDGFKTSKSVLGEFTVDGKTYYGLLAQAVIAGYIEGSTIVGGTINIGNGAFMVDKHGNVTMGGESKIGNMTVQDLQNYMADENNVVYTSCPLHGNYLANEIWVVRENDYVQTDENGRFIDGYGYLIQPTIMGQISDDGSFVLDANGDILGTIQDEAAVVDSNETVIGVYDRKRNSAYEAIGFVENGRAYDFYAVEIGIIDGQFVVSGGSTIGFIVEGYIADVSVTEYSEITDFPAGSVLRSLNDGNGIYKSTDWVSALGKYDKQHSDLSDRVGSIEGDLDQHFEFSNDNGLVIKDGNSVIYTRLLNNRWSFMQQEDNPLVGDAEVAYISEKKLHISSAEIIGLNGEDGNLDVNGPAKVKELQVENTSANNMLVIQPEDNGSFSILVQMQGG